MIGLIATTEAGRGAAERLAKAWPDTRALRRSRRLGAAPGVRRM